MVVGVLLGHFIPTLPSLLGRFEYARISIPMAILIWVMVYPMMLKVDFNSVRNVGKNPKGLFVTWITNWLNKPFTMYGIAALFFFVIFKAFITSELAILNVGWNEIYLSDIIKIYLTIIENIGDYYEKSNSTSSRLLASQKYH